MSKNGMRPITGRHHYDDSASSSPTSPSSDTQMSASPPNESKSTVRRRLFEDDSPPFSPIGGQPASPTSSEAPPLQNGTPLPPMPETPISLPRPMIPGNDINNNNPEFPMTAAAGLSNPFPLFFQPPPPPPSPALTYAGAAAAAQFPPQNPWHPQPQGYFQQPPAPFPYHPDVPAIARPTPVNQYVASYRGSFRPGRECKFCKNNGETPELYRSHVLRNPSNGLIICPVLRSHVCDICGATGDNAHTRNYCQELKTQRRMRLAVPIPVQLKNTKRQSDGQFRQDRERH